jgi:hypothetical protein
MYTGGTSRVGSDCFGKLGSMVVLPKLLVCWICLPARTEQLRGSKQLQRAGSPGRL